MHGRMIWSWIHKPVTPRCRWQFCQDHTGEARGRKEISLADDERVLPNLGTKKLQMAFQCGRFMAGAFSVIDTSNTHSGKADFNVADETKWKRLDYSLGWWKNHTLLPQWSLEKPSLDLGPFSKASWCSHALTEHFYRSAALWRDAKFVGYSRLVQKSDQEPSILALANTVNNTLTANGVDCQLESSPKEDSHGVSRGEANSAVSITEGFARTLKDL